MDDRSERTDVLQGECEEFEYGLSKAKLRSAHGVSGIDPVPTFGYGTVAICLPVLVHFVVLTADPNVFETIAGWTIYAIAPYLFYVTVARIQARRRTTWITIDTGPVPRSHGQYQEDR